MKKYAEWHGPLWFACLLLFAFNGYAFVDDIHDHDWIWAVIALFACYISLKWAQQASDRYERNYGPWVKGKGRS